MPYYKKQFMTSSPRISRAPLITAARTATDMVRSIGGAIDDSAAKRSIAETEAELATEDVERVRAAAKKYALEVQLLSNELQQARRRVEEMRTKLKARQ